MEYYGIDNTSKRRSRCGESNSCSDPGGEVRGEDSHTGDEQTACPDTYTEGLREEYLPVRMAKAEHHLAQNQHDTSHDE